MITKSITHAIVAATFVCISRAEQDQCTYHDPEDGVGHVAYSDSLPFFDLARESTNECEAVHGDEQCVTSCFISRGEE